MNEKMPSPEQLAKIQKENMSEEQIKQSNEREEMINAVMAMRSNEQMNENERIIELIEERVNIIVEDLVNQELKFIESMVADSFEEKSRESMTEDIIKDLKTVLKYDIINKHGYLLGGKEKSEDVRKAEEGLVQVNFIVSYTSDKSLNNLYFQQLVPAADSKMINEMSEIRNEYKRKIEQNKK